MQDRDYTVLISALPTKHTCSLTCPTRTLAFYTIPGHASVSAVFRSGWMAGMGWWLHNSYIRPWSVYPTGHWRDKSWIRPVSMMANDFPITQPHLFQTTGSAHEAVFSISQIELFSAFYSHKSSTWSRTFKLKTSITEVESLPSFIQLPRKQLSACLPYAREHSGTRDTKLCPHEAYFW